MYTSAAIPVQIVPKCGFIPASYTTSVKIFWEKKNQPDLVTLNNTMFMVKALPLKQDMDIDFMEKHKQVVFNTYNVNILFTTHHLRSKVKENRFDPAMMQQMQQR